MYEYQALILRVIDGDTVQAAIDLGFHVSCTATLRLAGLNAPEIRGPERPRGLAAKQFLEELITTRTAGSNWLTVRTQKDATEKYGRYLAELIAAGASLNELLVQAGHAVPYEG